MDALLPPEAERGGRPLQDTQAEQPDLREDDATQPLDRDAGSGATEEERNGESGHATNGNAQVEVEGAGDVNGHILETATPDETPTSLRPAPPPSKKRRESEASHATAEVKERPSSKGNKRPRAVSPPWNLGKAEVTTIKTEDGRRASARHRPTPATSESEGRSRATSLSRPPSPPWKKFAAEGPTTIEVDGRRRSGRANKELSEPAPKPKRVSPRTKKLVDKIAQEKERATPKPRPASKAGIKKEEQESARPSSAQDKIKTLQEQIAALQPQRSWGDDSPMPASKAGHKRKHSSNEPTPQRRLSSPKPARKSQRQSEVSQSPDVSRPGFKLKLKRAQIPDVPVHPPHPQAMPPSPPRPPRPNLYQIIESYELQEAQAPYSENERGPPSREEFAIRHQKAAEQEAIMRRKLLKAAEPGNPLSVEACSVYRDEQQEPPQQYGHHDHLAAHAIYFRGLQKKEEVAHRALAKKVAQDCLEEWKRRRGPTEEDLQAEADKVFKLIAKQVVVDMRAKWEMAGQYVEARKREKWEAEQEVKRQERLKRQLEYSEQLVARQRGGVESEMVSDEEDSMGDMRSDEEQADGSSDDDEEESEENMSESESDSGPGAEREEEEAEGDMDQDALAAYLAQRDAEPPDRPRDSLAELLDDPRDEVEQGSEDGNDDDDAMDGAESMVVNPTDAGTVDGETVAADKTCVARLQRDAGPAPNLEDEDEDGLSDDESTDMDSEDYDSDEDMSDSNDEGTNGDDEDEDEEGADSDDNAHENPLFALFRPEEKRAFGLLTPGTSAVASAEENNADAEEEHGQPAVVAERVGEADGDEPIEQGQATEAQVAEPQDTEMADATDASFHTADVGETVENTAVPKPIESIMQTSIPGTPTSQARSDPTSKQLIPQPSLLRGDLRSYQHAGLDWLASLYRNHTNGILADEMGLGKTIQTIALLAHLAEHHEVWETHLVIVPTSVILNWVTEFQKFLPGFRVLGYYGTNEERAIKRKGWVNDPHHEQKDKRGYNVIVTSYNIALKDINALRNVRWHYMVLDEAHNIRNFNSQRFQVLIKLRTRARLLLTGTPLQNSLTELWSLLTFLTAGGDEPGHGSLDDFLNHWREPVREIFERGVQTLSDEASRVVSNLHTSLRPFMLRRLKSDVEKDLPKKTEHTVVCKLSKRQRQLYQDYMGLADTKAKLAHGNAVSAGTVLYSLRRVCNHPDQFDPRPIQTSFAMEQSPLEPFSIKERLVRQLLGFKEDMPERLDVVRNEVISKYLSSRSKKLSASATQHLQRQAAELEKSLGSSEHDFSTITGCQAYQRWKQRQNKLRTLRDAISVSRTTVERTPIYGSDLRECLTVRGTRASSGYHVMGQMSIVTRPPALDSKIIPWEFQKGEKAFDKLLSRSTLVQQSLPTLSQYGEEWRDKVVRFAFCTPEATAPTLSLALPPRLQSFIRANNAYSESTPDFAHEARIRNSIVFPDSRLLLYDSGKLQRLTHLLRELQSRGSRSLIFTQMQDTLNILERFLSLIGLPYLRLDGQTSIERRALYAAEFNAKDSKYQVMILSSRAGGVGLNLTGASSVIFYDLDWNPQMDKQCMDRAHRIGQVRDVEVYKLVSEKTVEENILRRANQKSLLDQTVIQEGHFTTDYELAKPANDEEDEQDVTAAIDRFLSGGEKAISKTIESVEDREDVAAAQQARKEVDQDAEEFAERSSKGPSVPPTPGAEESGLKEGHVDSYMVRFVETVMEGVPFVPPVVRRLDKHGRDPSHRPKRKR